ncbi:FtsX-like permease family protein [Crossiella cryophila]|uniref:ABC-type antimicrobial peptide transport system permease subunit n=1 Tax=Crossiella cryophila TaxID=43355 RepID=A0A7W7C7T3_9PSEU|nr:FtsX-like permease family protein [Crossiella cryophila]MBB4676065.1 ABC-type antimicrobial peptide transport system permease subunit [Crossiella cryophila]
MNPFQLALRVLRGDRRSLVAAVCTLFGVAIAVTLVSWLAAVPGALDARAEHEAWRQPGPLVNESAATVRVKNSQDRVRDKVITRVDVAALTPDAPAAPGLLRVPQPGEVLLSPALAALARDLPADQLAKRFQGKVIGELGDQALIYPGELVAVVGHSQQTLVEDSYPAAGLVPTGQPRPEFMLLLLSQVGLVVLVVPSLVLIASSARLTAARRERRLAALRLAGATPGQVVAITVVEIAVATVLGTLLGLALGPVARELTTQLPWNGGTWFAADLEPSWLLSLGIGLGTPLLVIGAAVFGLRRVLTQPLGAAQQHSRKAPSAWRLLILIGAAGAFIGGISVASATGGTSVLVGGLAGIALAASVVGPWLTSVVGRIFTKVWRRPSTLLAGRRLRDDPKAAYRAASGVVLAVFAGSLALTVLPSLEQKVDNRTWQPWKEGVLYTTVSSTEVQTAAERLRVELAKRGVNTPVGAAAHGNLKDKSGHYVGRAVVLGCEEATALMWLPLGPCGGAPGVRVGKGQQYPAGPLQLSTYAGRDEGSTPLPEKPVVHQMAGDNSKTGGVIVIDPALIPKGAQLTGYTLTVMTSPANAELVRTLLIEQVPGGRIGSLEAQRGRDDMQVGDMRRIALIGLIIAGLLGGISAAITAAGSVVDRRRTLAALIAAGTPVRVLARALRTEAALPSLVATLGAGLAGLAVGGALMTLVQAPLTVNYWLVTPLVIGFGVALVAASACGPLLRRISPQAYAEE